MEVLPTMRTRVHVEKTVLALVQIWKKACLAIRTDVHAIAHSMAIVSSRKILWVTSRSIVGHTEIQSNMMHRAVQEQGLTFPAFCLASDFDLNQCFLMASSMLVTFQ
jgi:hypothetical protein